MARVFEKEEFDSFKDRNSGAFFSDLEFRNCLFRSCSISRTTTFNPDKRSRIQNVRLFNCEAAGCFLGPAFLEDVLVDGLRIPKVLIAESPTLKHVVLRGKIDRLIIGQVLYGGMPYENYLKVVSIYEQANAEYYKAVDWALDISQGEFSDVSIRGIPSRLVRRDTFTQAVVKREKAISGEWKALDLSGTWWAVSLDMLARSSWEDGILVAPKRHRQFNHALKGLHILREAGIAEPE